MLQNQVIKKIWGRCSPQNSFYPTFLFSCGLTLDLATKQVLPQYTHAERMRLEEKWYHKEQESCLFGGSFLHSCKSVSPPNPAFRPMARKKVELPELPFIQSSRSARNRSNIPHITDTERKKPKVWWLRHNHMSCKRSIACKQETTK